MVTANRRFLSNLVLALCLTVLLPGVGRWGHLVSGTQQSHVRPKFGAAAHQHKNTDPDVLPARTLVQQPGHSQPDPPLQAGGMPLNLWLPTTARFQNVWPILQPASSAPATLQYHSQSGEDKYAYQTFFHGMQTGVYMELGALDGKHWSNTKFFETLGWRGVLIEANPDKFLDLTKKRPNDVCVHAAICATPAQLHYIRNEAVSGIYEFMSKDFIQRWHANVDLSQTTPVSCLSLGALLGKLGVTHIDFWSLDVEGAEMQVLQTFDFDQVTVNVMVVENDGTNPSQTAAIREILATHGLRLTATVDRNDWFMRDGFQPSKNPRAEA